MKNLVKYKNRIYRRYSTDLWGQVIMKGKITRMFKHLLRVFSFKLKKIYLKHNHGRNISARILHVKRAKRDLHLKIQNSRFLAITPKKDYNMEKINKNYFKELRLTDSYVNFARSKSRFNNKPFKSGNSYFIGKWKKAFFKNFSKFQNINMSNNHRKIKKFFSLRKYLQYSEKSFKYQFFRTKYLEKVINKKRGVVSRNKKFRKKRALMKMRNMVFDLSTRIASYDSWLDLEKKFKTKKFTTWWNLRGAIRKTSIFYGILSLKKFRYIENFINRKNALKAFFAMKLETMINIILYRVNLFSNIYFANNFVRGGGVLINNKIVYYPFRSIRKNDLIWINKIFFKKIFNIFFKKLFFSKKILIKNKKLKAYNKVNATKILLNNPNYLEVNYKILHIIMWRFPNRNELAGFVFSSTRSVYDWSLSNRSSYL